MLIDVLARLFLLCIAIFWNKHVNDCVTYLHSQGIGSDCPFFGISMRMIDLSTL